MEVIESPWKSLKIRREPYEPPGREIIFRTIHSSSQTTIVDGRALSGSGNGIPCDVGPAYLRRASILEGNIAVQYCMYNWI